MTQVAVTAGVYPTTNRIGGDDYGVHTERNLASIVAVLADQSYFVAGFQYTSDGLDASIAPGIAVISGYHVAVTGGGTVAVSDNTTTYIYLRLLRDGLGNVTETVFETASDVAPADSVLLLIAVAVSGVATLLDARPRGLNAHRVDGYHASQYVTPNTAAVRDSEGNLPGRVAEATVADNVTAAHLQYLQPSDTVLWTYNDINQASWAVAVPRLGVIRVKVTVSQTEVGGTLEGVTIEATGDSVVTLDRALPHVSLGTGGGLIIKSVQLCGAVNASPEPIVL